MGPPNLKLSVGRGVARHDLVRRFRRGGDVGDVGGLAGSKALSVGSSHGKACKLCSKLQAPSNIPPVVLGPLEGREIALPFLRAGVGAAAQLGADVLDDQVEIVVRPDVVCSESVDSHKNGPQAVKIRSESVDSFAGESADSAQYAFMVPERGCGLRERGVDQTGVHALPRAFRQSYDYAHPRQKTTSVLLGGGSHRLMRPQEGAHPVDGAGQQLGRLAPREDRDLGVRRQRCDIDRGPERVCRCVVG
jgi:hypothetical protein